MKKTFLIFILLISAFSLTGCWDNVEINNREYIFAVGIDKGEDGNLIFTAEIPKINEGSKEERLIYTAESKNFANFYNDSFLRSDKVISDRLMQVIVIGESTASDPNCIKRIFDEIERSPQINRRVKIAVAKGDAKDIITTEIPSNPIVGRYLSELLVKLKKENYQDIYTFDEALLNFKDFNSEIIPMVEKIDHGLRVERAAVMKNYQYIGNLSYDENEIILLLLDPSNSNMKNINIKVEDAEISLGAVSIRTIERIDLNGDKLAADYYVDLFCYIDSFELGNKSLADQKFLDEIKSTAINQISEQTVQTINRLQKVYKSDLLKIKDKLYKYHKTSYDKIKDNYEQVFSDANINVHYSMEIKSTGLVK
nr:Ger(x)C family spore germination protein [Sedimentibacter sp.]